MIQVKVKSSSPIKTKVSSIKPTELKSPPTQVLYGKSAYDLAVKNGYTGTEAEWVQQMNHPLLSNIVIQDDDCLILNCGDSVNVIGD